MIAEMDLMSQDAHPTLLAAHVVTMSGSVQAETSAFPGHSSAMGRTTARITAMSWDVVSSRQVAVQ